MTTYTQKEITSNIGELTKEMDALLWKCKALNQDIKNTQNR